MKLRVKRSFKYMVDNVTAHQRNLEPGDYEVPADVPEGTALLAIQFGAAVFVFPPKKIEKVAPENKMVKVAENKAGKHYKDKNLRKSPKRRASRKK